MPGKEFGHVYWIGGGSGGGKSSVATHLAAQLGARVYSCDDAMADHAARGSAQQCPLLHEFLAMDMDQRWVRRSPEEMLATFHWFAGEGFGLIVEDLLGLPQDVPVIVEGFRLLPHLVQPLLGPTSRAVWLCPSPEFREQVFARRGGVHWSFLGKTSDPERALQNLLKRDELFTLHLAEQTRRLGLPRLVVDGSLTVEELAQKVAAGFEWEP